MAEFLEHDPSRQIVGTDELLRRLISFTETATAKLDGVHFDIDPRVRFCDARLAPEGPAAAPYYYRAERGPLATGHHLVSDPRQDDFSWWRYVSTWYHEGGSRTPPAGLRRRSSRPID